MVSDYEIGYALSADTGSTGPGPDLLAVLRDDPFVPNDSMDWVMGVGFVTAPYIVLLASGNAHLIPAYQAVAPDLLMFAAGVSVSNLIQVVSTSRGGRYSTHSPAVTSGFMMV